MALEDTAQEDTVLEDTAQEVSALAAIAHPQEAITVTVDHVRGSHIIIDANVGGGIYLEARQTPNSLGGRTINILTSKAGVEMLTYHADTSKVDTAAMLKVGLKGELTLNPE